MLSQLALSSWQAPYSQVITGRQQGTNSSASLLVCRQSDGEAHCTRGSCCRRSLFKRSAHQPAQAVPQLDRHSASLRQGGPGSCQGGRAPFSCGLCGSQHHPCAIEAKGAVIVLQGQRPDESLDVELALPLFQAQPKAAAAPVEQPVRRQNPLGLGDILSVPRFGLGPSLALPSGTLTTLFVSACCLLFRLRVLEDLCWACRVHNDTSDLFSHCRQWGQGQPLLPEMRPAHYVCRGNSAV